ncbi:MAG: hypothetical protein WCW56_03280 [Candidatus Paceibacterota bacterium]|jgi:hypothetical protein
MKSRFSNLKPEVISLRTQGKSYGEIRKVLNVDIPQSTLSCWCKNILLSRAQQSRIKVLVAQGSKKARATALVVNRARREAYLRAVKNRVLYLSKKLEDRDVAKIALAMLYLGEGSKRGGAIMFGNSDQAVIKLFLKLLRYCYNIDESKFRCTVQCRSDQNVEELEIFWSKFTNISRDLFYRPQIDKRTIGSVTKKVDYRGVCRIDYFSADIFIELMQVIKVFEE